MPDTCSSLFSLSAFLFIGIALAFFLPGKTSRCIVSITLLLAFLTLLITFAGQPNWSKLVLTTLGMLYVIKLLILLRLDSSTIASYSKVGLLLYMTVWPGMDPQPFRTRQTVEENGKRFVRGVTFMTIGMILALSAALASGLGAKTDSTIFGIGSEIVGWLGLASLLCLIHLGYSEILTTLMRLSGWNVQPLFEEPLKSQSLHEFWSHRWNMAFVEMNKVLFLPIARKFLPPVVAVLAMFLLSGLLHDLAISYPVASNWGLPTLYFALTGLAFLIERRLVVRDKPLIVRLVWTWFWLVVPLPLLFTRPFRDQLIVPLFQTLTQFLSSHDLRFWFDIALWCAAIGNFCTIGAGIQVPVRMNWKEQLASLTTFNRKIILNYYYYTGLTIIAWGVLTIVLHKEMLDGDRSALCLATFIGIYWLLRILVDFFYFKHDDWPKGPMMVIGHTCLTLLFFALTLTYLGLVIWHVAFHSVPMIPI